MKNLIWFLVIVLFVFASPVYASPGETFREIQHEQAITLRPFSSGEELKLWLAVNKVDEMPIKTTFGGNGIDGACEDYALKLQEDALKDGYILNFQCFGKGKIPMSNYYVKTAHAMNSAVIGNEVWLIEPATDECWLAWYLN